MRGCVWSVYAFDFFPLNENMLLVMSGCSCVVMYYMNTCVLYYTVLFIDIYCIKKTTFLILDSKNMYNMPKFFKGAVQHFGNDYAFWFASLEHIPNEGKQLACLCLLWMYKEN